MPQPQLRHESQQLNDIQMLQRQIMMKKLQELQRQQQFHELGDARQHNYMNQQYTLNRQISRDQFSPLINGTPITDASQRFMTGNINLMHPGMPPVIQGFSNGTGFTHPQGQVNASLYGTPVPGVGNNPGRYSQLLGASQGLETTFQKGNNSQQNEIIAQSSNYDSTLSSYNHDPSSNQVGFLEGGVASIGDFQMKNLFGQVSPQPLHRNYQQMDTLHRSTSALEVGGRQEQAGWSEQLPGQATNMCPSQDLCSLDPLEQKILFNRDDNSWDASFGSLCNDSSEGLKNIIENTDNTNVFPSLQSGSWSALMQSAVAETSSSDAGQQENWSGSSFQIKELSNDRSSNLMESGKQHSDWVEKSMQTVSSLYPKPEPISNNLNMNNGFPGFQQPGIQFSLKQNDGLHSETSQDSRRQHSFKNNNRWLDPLLLQKQANEVTQQGQRLSSLQKAWPDPKFERSESEAYQDSKSIYTKGTQAGGISGLEHVRSNNVNKNRPIPESNKLHYDNNTDDSVKDGRIEYVRNNQYHRSSSPQLSTNTYNGASRTDEKEQRNERENSIDSYHSNASQPSITGHDMKQNMWQHKSNSRHVADNNQSLSDQVMYPQIPQGSRGYESGYAEQFKFHNISSDSDLKKRHLPHIQRNLTDDVSSRNVDTRSTFFDTSVPNGPNMTTETSHHMLELLYKVDKSKDYQPIVQVGSRDSTPFSEVPQVPQAGSPEAFPTQSYNKPFPSQTFGLRLSPPSQQIPVSDCFVSSQSSPQMENSGDKGSLGPSLLRNQYQSQHQDTPSNSYSQHLPVLGANPVTQPFVSSGSSQQLGFPMLWKNAPVQRNSYTAEPRNVSFSFPPSLESNNNDSVKASVAPHMLHYESKGQNETSKCSMSLKGLDLEGEKAAKEAYGQLDSSGTVVPVTQKGKLAYEQVAKGFLETNAANPGYLMTNSNQLASDWALQNVNQSRSTSDLEVFGRSLEPSHIPPHTYSPQNQVHLPNKIGRDSDHSVLQSNANVGQNLYGYSSGIQKPVENEMKTMPHNSLFPTEEGMLQKISSEVGGNQLTKMLSGPLRDANQETVTCGQYSSPVASVAANQSHISLQMAPSWFKHYGTLRNGQMMPTFDPRAAHQFSPGNMLDKLQMGSSVAGHESVVWPTTSDNLVSVKNLAPAYELPPDVLVQNPEIVRPKKRKVAAVELLAWHKETSQCSQKLYNVSLSGLEWAEATNRLFKKVEDEGATIEDSPFVRPKKRLATTTQLMQYIFRPPPTVILGGDATSNCEAMAYFAARLALGDACCLESSSHMLCDGSDTPSGKVKTSMRIGDRESVKVVEDLLTWSAKVEARLLIVEKSASISDIRVESQELEKFSMINHFAKFHSRGAAGVAEASTSSGTKRLFLQRYVKPVPMPRTLPEGVQCLAL